MKLSTTLLKLAVDPPSVDTQMHPGREIARKQMESLPAPPSLAPAPTPAPRPTMGVATQPVGQAVGQFARDAAHAYGDTARRAGQSVGQGARQAGQNAADAYRGAGGVSGMVNSNLAPARAAGRAGADAYSGFNGPSASQIGQPAQDAYRGSGMADKVQSAARHVQAAGQFAGEAAGAVRDATNFVPGAPKDTFNAKPAAGVHGRAPTPFKAAPVSKPVPNPATRPAAGSNPPPTDAPPK